jgi:hypothetical protein
MEKLINVYIVWSLDGPIMTTLLQFDDNDMQRQAMQQWSTFDYIRLAFDAEFPDEEIGDSSYELVAIFEANDLRFIYLRYIY